MPFLLAYPASTGVVIDPGPAGATFSFISAMPGGVSVSRSGSATHINSTGYVVLDALNAGRIDSDPLVDGLPPGSAAKELGGVSALSVISGFSISSAGPLAPVLSSGSLGLLVPTITSPTSSSINLASVLSSGAAGTLRVGSVALVGAPAVGMAGNSTIATTAFVSFSGNAGTGAAGVLAANSSTGSTLVGNAGTGTVGTLGFTSAPPVTSSLAAVGSAGSFSLVLTPPILAAVLGSGAVGILAVSAVRPPGVLGAGTVGIVTLATTRTPAAAVATASIGNLSLAGPPAGGGFSSGFSSGFATQRSAFSSGFSSGFGP